MKNIYYIYIYNIYSYSSSEKGIFLFKYNSIFQIKQNIYK